MQRFLMADLLEWKDSPHRKPLVLNGARQVGKTWLLKELGKTAFKNVAYVSFDNNPQLASLFDKGMRTLFGTIRHAASPRLFL